jgi:hypothetical protein
MKLPPLESAHLAERRIGDDPLDAAAWFRARHLRRLTAPTKREAARFRGGLPGEFRQTVGPLGDGSELASRV